ncbi:hypothetical protein HX030_12640 [Myroides odoratimimus]|uniref:Uncharacterized protein n=1 Tax=Myroides marinus TaxID=703342 RepID=A0A163X158_9FLAO|nr:MULTISPECIES: hypothetical protein [Myroides]KZE77151.1 hypothetical protein AV926_14570 [Myroides marinus]MDM1467876.1 hypothetical protein [Myroides odoratimimus]MDM1471122.1 hypothetical protein [Myroides odoratimimus]MDM1481217.1 hypothetical protein [Myroides odoratimimus]QBK77456.1 hypothetical protein E0Z07_14375 [Myroides odoratimimus]
MSFNIGDLVVFNTHPYTETYFNIKIVGYSEYTPPIMIVNKVNDKSPKGLFVECIYYDSKGGKYLIKNLKGQDLKILDYPNNLEKLVGDEKLGFFERKKMLFEIDILQQMLELDKEFTDSGICELMKDEYFHKKVALKSIDIELHKHKINRENINGELIETNHLEFLPPVMSIIDFRFINEKNKFCKVTNTPLIELKCKWYNSQSKTYSEDFFKAEILYEINQHLEADDVFNYYLDQLESNSYNIVTLDKEMKLEESNITVKYTLVQIQEILFKHYFYQAFVVNLIDSKKESRLIKEKATEISEKELWGAKFPNFKEPYGRSILEYKFDINQYYYILYSDKLDRLTKRIIYVRNYFIVIVNHQGLLNSLGLKKLTPKNLKIRKALKQSNTFYVVDGKKSIGLSRSEDYKDVIFVDRSILSNKNVNVFIETNCLLKNGKIRHFRLDSIFSVTKIENGCNLFEKGIVEEINND